MMIGRSGTTAPAGAATELAGRLRGPMATVRVPFHRDGSIDSMGLQHYVDRCINNGAHALLLTYGDSLLSLLTDDETVEVTRLVIDAVNHRLPLIAADRSWWTGKTVEFARWSAEAGADAVMVLPPDWGHSSTASSLVEHYNTVAHEIPIVLVTTFLRSRPVPTALDIVEQVWAAASNIAAVKDDVGGEFARRMTSLVASSWTVIAGGTKSAHLDLVPYGCQGYLSTLSLFRPDLVAEYTSAIAGGDLSKAAAFVTRYDRPMFDMLMASTGGFDAAIHGWCELAGLCSRWRRPPYHDLTDDELDQLADALDQLGLAGR